MIKIVLDSESHGNGVIKKYSNVFVSDDVDVIKRVAKIELCFLYGINSYHIKRHLINSGIQENEIIKNFELWKKEIIDES